MASYVEKLKEMRNQELERTLKGAIGSAIHDIKGETFYVDSNTGADTSGGLSWDNALATIDAAINLCTANRGDLILVAPNHAETISDATSLIPDVDGVNIVGVGVGTDRPTITFDNTASNIPISGDNVYIENILCVAGVDSIVAGITISGSDCTIRKVEWRDTTDIEAILAILTTAAADRLTIDGFVHNGFVTGNACTDAIRLIGVNNALITNCIFTGNYSTAIIEFHTTACTNVIINNSVFLETGTTDFSLNVVDTVTGSTWSVDGFDVAAGARFSGGSGSAIASDDVSTINSKIGTVVNAGGVASIGAILGDFANVSLISYMGLLLGSLNNSGGGTALPSNKSLYDVLSGAALNVDTANYLTASIDFTSATWNTVATHELFTVTGLVRMRMAIECTEALTGATATLELGIEDDTDAFIATTTATDIIANELWYDATPTTSTDTTSTVVIDKVVAGGKDVGYEVKTAALTDGTLVFHVWWEALNATGAVVAGDGSAMV